MAGWRLRLGIVIGGLGLWSSATAPVAAQGTNETPPEILSMGLSTTPCSAPTPWVNGTSPCLKEGDPLYVCLEVTDLDWRNLDQNANLDNQGLIVTMRSTWYPYFANGIQYGPEPPPVSSDGTSGPYPAAGVTLNFVRDLQVVFDVPQFVGANQARLRGDINFDARWFVQITVYNGGASGQGDPNTAVRRSFTVCAVSNPALAPGNPPPSADAGPDQTVGLDPRTNQVVVHLDGSRTSDGSNVGFNPAAPSVFDKDTLQYTWEWISGPVRVDPVADSSGNPAKAQVTLDVPTPDSDPYVFRLLVEDGTNALPSADETRVFVRTALPVNHAPRAKIAGPSGPVPVGGIIRLDGSVSQDTDGDQLTYLWTQTNEVGGALASDQVQTAFQPLSGLTAAVSTWQAVTVGTFYFRLLVTDQPALRDAVLTGEELTSAAIVTVQVSNTATSGAQMAAVRDGQTDPGASAPQPAPAGCGTGLSALGLVPPGLWLMRGRRR